MPFKVEDISSVKKTLHIEIPQEEVVQELDKAYKQLKKSAKVKGFRPGKVPRSVLERMFKKDVHADVSSRLIQNSFIDAIKQTELKIVGNPELDPPELAADRAYQYKATVEISPDIDDIDFKGLQLTRTLYEPGDDEVDAQLKALQKNMAQYEKVAEDRPAREGDFILIDLEGLHGGEPVPAFAKTENFSLQIGKAIISEEFDKQITGMKTGETKNFTVSFDKDFPNEKLAGLDVVFEVFLNEIRQEILPPINDALAKKAGPYKTLDDLKSVILENIKQGYDKRTEQELNEQIFKELLGRTSFEVPDAMVEMELQGIVEEAERSFAYRNTSLEEMGLSKESISEKYRDTALNQVKRHLILGKIIDQEKIGIDDEELENGLKEMSENFNQPLEGIKQYYDQNKDKLELFKHTLLEKKAIKLILDSSRIKDVKPDKSAKTPSKE
ncbi:MAG: trigger factor [Deltaproteobacteria bacterium]|jgi:trigger factor|nr:trigger factor [Deltaproteobacteria bacterium]